MTDAATNDPQPHLLDELEQEASHLSGTESVWRDPNQTGWFAHSSDISACLTPLLQALEVNFNEVQIFEALPHFTEDLDIDGLRNTLANLQFESKSVDIKLADHDPRALPVLYIPNHGSAMVVLFFTGEEALVFDGGIRQNRRIKTAHIDGEAYFFRQLEQAEVSNRSNYRDWFSTLVSRFRPILTLALGLTLFINVISLAIPLFVMAIYDSVVGTQSVSMLIHLVAGAILTLGADFTLRKLRTRAVSYFGARIDNLVGNEVFRHILYLPPPYTESATISSQVARIKDFDGVRDFVTGPQALILFELWVRTGETRQGWNDDADAIMADVNTVRGASALAAQLRDMEDTISSLGLVEIPGAEKTGAETTGEVVAIAVVFCLILLWAFSDTLSFSRATRSR